MEQFSLEKYLENKSRKVVTRRGNPVRVICTDRKHGEDELPVVFLEETPDGIGEFLLSCRADGTSDNHDTLYDLFFADEEEELTEFEKRIYSLINFSDPYNYPSIKEVKEEAEILLDLAREEILKDLPKWKKATENKDFDNHVLLFEDEDRVVLTEGIYKDEYYIDLDDLKSLPKE